MPSTQQLHTSIVRREENLHDIAESNSSISNKRKKVQYKLINHFNMQPVQEANIGHSHADQLLAKQDAVQSAGPEVKKEEEEAATLLKHMRQADQQQQNTTTEASHADRVYDIDRHDNGSYGNSGDEARRMNVDGGMLHRSPALHVAGENSGSSDGSAAYFSGDSDLTAEPIMGRPCAAEDNEAARSSNSGSSSTPLPKPKSSQTHKAHADPNNSEGLGAMQAYSVNLAMMVDEKMSDVNEEVGYAPAATQMATTTNLVQPPDRSTTSASCRCKDPPIFNTAASPELMRMVHTDSIMSCRWRSSLPPECADSSRNLKESWLELRLGFSADDEDQSTRLQTTEMKVQMPAGQRYINESVKDEERKWRESEYSDHHQYAASMEQAERVTLQLLPDQERPPNVVVTEAICSTGAGTSIVMPILMQRSVQNPPVAADISVLCPTSRPSVNYHPPTTSCSQNNGGETPFDMSGIHRLTGGSAVPHAACGHVLVHDQTRDPNIVASSQYLDQFLHLSQGSNQNHRRPAFPGSANWEPTALNAHHHILQEGRWTPNSSDHQALTNLLLQAQSTPGSINGTISAQPPQVYRPTPSVGWPPGRAAPSSEGRPWSVHSHMTPVLQAQAQKNMTWQGLLSSMANEPLLPAHARTTSLQPILHSFDDGANIINGRSGVMRRRHNVMLPAAAAGPEARSTSHANYTSAPQYRLRLASSVGARRRNDLWFSLQEAYPFPEEKGALSNQCTQKIYLRIRDGKMQISVVKSYLIKKLGSAGLHHYNSDEVDIACRGQVLSPSLTIQHVRDTIWLNKDVDVEALGFRYTTSHKSNSQSRVMALCYQRHHTSSQTLTLNLLKN